LVGNRRALPGNDRRSRAAENLERSGDDIATLAIAAFTCEHEAASRMKNDRVGSEDRSVEEPLALDFKRGTEANLGEIANKHQLSKQIRSIEGDRTGLRFYILGVRIRCLSLRSPTIDVAGHYYDDKYNANGSHDIIRRMCTQIPRTGIPLCPI
jgi:hypothetical protein